MRIRILALRLVVAVAVCYLSFTLFAQTSAYAAIERLANLALPGIRAGVVIPALLTVVVLCACLFSGERSARFIYFLSILLYLPSVLSFSGINWAVVLGVPIEAESASLFDPTLLVGLAIVVGYLLLRCTSWLENTHAQLTGRGGTEREVNAAVSGQLAVSALVISASVAAASLAALLPRWLPWTGTAFEGIPSAYAVLGFCGGLLILACTSFYLLAVREKRLERLEESLSEEKATGA